MVPKPSQGVPVATYPANKVDWDRRAAFMLRDYDATNNKLARDLLERLLQFANGDSSGSVITHFCLMSDGNGEPCCKSDQEAICKFLAVAVPFFCKGYPTPLLYRMKHYKPASSYIKVGCMFFNLLPRVLAEIHSQQQLDSEIAQCVDVFMKDATGHASSQADFEHLLADALDADRNYAVQNGLRRRMVAQEVSRQGFHHSAMVIDCLIQPLEYGINFMLGHTKTLMDLQYLGCHHKVARELQSKTRAGFLQLVTGELADSVLKKYITLLDEGLRELISMGFLPTPERLNLMFTSVVVLCTDIYRRLKHDFLPAPFSLFPMIDMDTERFMQSWANLEKQHERCQFCLDEEFTVALLRQFPGLAAKPSCERDAAQAEIKALLSDIATWSAVTSDVVELKNGQVQFAVSRRGSQHVKGPRAAAELSFLQAAVLQHEWVKEALATDTMPRKSLRSGVASMSGVKTTRLQDGLVRPLYIVYLYVSKG